MPNDALSPKVVMPWAGGWITADFGSPCQCLEGTGQASRGWEISVNTRLNSLLVGRKQHAHCSGVERQHWPKEKLSYASYYFQAMSPQVTPWQTQHLSLPSSAQRTVGVTTRPRVVPLRQGQVHVLATRVPAWCSRGDPNGPLLFSSLSCLPCLPQSPAGPCTSKPPGRGGAGYPAVLAGCI